jgi:PKD repeat protein
MLRASAWSVQPGASTAITATLYDATMAPVIGARTLTFTTDLGTVVPEVIHTADGEAVVTFNAGATQGEATVIATTGRVTESVRIQVSDLAPPQASFAADTLSGGSPLTVTFTDQSLNDPTAWIWDFGDGATSREQRPTHVYTTTGTYTVTLNASNALGADSLTKPSYISITETLSAGFSASPTQGPAPLAVVFTNTSTGAYTHALWDYGDGASYSHTLSLLSHVHTYTAAGLYTVTLTVSDGGITDTLTRPGYIQVMESVYLPLVLRQRQ